MFREPTVFIVGAGASAEFDLPSGEALKTTIRKMTPARSQNFAKDNTAGDNLVYEALKLASTNAHGQLDIAALDRRLAAAKQISTSLSLAGSIDALLESHSDDEDMRLYGKLAIVKAIVGAESQSRLKKYKIVEDDPKLEASIAGTWYPEFAKMIFEGRRPGDGPRIFENLFIICFNYDRCIEQFLFIALRRYFAMDEDTARIAMTGLKIVHPYGTVGGLPWRSETDTIEFGAEIDADRLLSVQSRIRVYTEQQRDTKIVEDIQKCVSTARRAVFLGFGFHRQNLELIKPRDGSQIGVVLSTSLGLSAEDVAMARQLAVNTVKFRGTTPNIIFPYNCSCTALFSQLSLTLKN